MPAITPKFRLNNRSDKHKFRNEAIRSAEVLQHIVDDFVDLIFNAPDRFNYTVIYQQFHDRWVSACKHLKIVKPKLKVINIDQNFFAEEFSPTNLAKKKFETKFELIIFK